MVPAIPSGGALDVLAAPCRHLGMAVTFGSPTGSPRPTQKSCSNQVTAGSIAAPHRLPALLMSTLSGPLHHACWLTGGGKSRRAAYC